LKHKTTGWTDISRQISSDKALNIKTIYNKSRRDVITNHTQRNYIVVSTQLLMTMTVWKIWFWWQSSLYFRNIF